ncbi:unnamed protein product [Allacma fusca]|uniref:Peptidase S1 domain-containing protein n=1 Tax=Allacma fusca TaxID=39272 RepID=A0A8J2LQ08_9HEXA|nr:unnamed protein product [Allacma fusca]
MKYVEILLFTSFVAVYFPGADSKLANACRFSQFRCNEGALCLDTEKLCNGVEDCPEGEDESGNSQYDCTRSTLSDDCQPGEFRCRFGGCIPNSLKCNGQPDCWGGTDEAIDFCYIEKPHRNTRPVNKPTKRPLQMTSDPPTEPNFQSTSHYNYPSAPPGAYPPTTRATTHTYVTTPAPDYTTKLIRAKPTTRVTPKPSFMPPMDSSCPPIELEAGQKVSCFHSKQALEIDCQNNLSPDGTQADISCKSFWIPPETGPLRSVRMCRNGRWTRGSSDFSCELDCGIGGTSPAPLVTGGRPSEEGKWPWHSGLYENDPPGSANFQHICGATLISRQAIMTAAHCVTFPSTNQKKNAPDLRVYLGKYHRQFSKNSEHVQHFRVREIIVHQKYNYAHLDNDIAILWLEKPVSITAFVHPVCMPVEESDDPQVGDVGTLAGWGSLGDRNYPEILHEAELPVRSNPECRKNSHVLANLVRDSNFCAGHSNGTSACDGDSGGGLVFKNMFVDNRYRIFGVVSGGVPKAGGRGCDPKYFVAFTRVAFFRRWIDRALDKLISL